MFGLLRTALNLITKRIKPGLHIDTRSYRTFIRIPKQFVTVLFHSKDAKQNNDKKSELDKLIKLETSRKLLPGEQEELHNKKSEGKSWQNYIVIVFGIIFVAGGIYLIFELGSPRNDSSGKEILDQYSSMPVVKQYMLRTLNELDYYRQLLKEPSPDTLLPDMVNHPLYHPQYTLVLEFTDVIVHPDWTYSTGWRFKKRPGLDSFLEHVHGVYEIVVYTAEEGITVFPIVDAVDPRNLINHKLVRDSTICANGKYLKDLDKMNRDLSKVIVVDWNGDCTRGHKDNVLRIPRWHGREDDVTLLHLGSFLLAISSSEINDVREVLRAYAQYDDPIATYRERQKQLIEKAEARAEEERNNVATQSSLSGWRSNFFTKIL